MNFLEFYQKRLDLQQAEFRRIDHNETMVAIVYKVIQPNGAPYILKICTRPDDYFHEVYFLRFFHGNLPVPTIINELPPEGDASGAILMECLPGILLKGAEFTSALAYDFGALLAQIHLNRTSGYGDLTQPNQLSHDPKYHFTLKFEEGLSECRSHLPQELLEKCRLYFDSYLHRLEAVDGPCIIHRDCRPGNLLIHEGKISGLIDWSSARSGFAEEDFCTLEHGRSPVPPKIQQLFLLGYQSVRPIPNYQTLMPLLRLSKAIATIGFTVKRGTWNNTHASLYQYNRDYLDTL